MGTLTKGHEDDKREGIAQYKFQDSSNHVKDATKEDVRSTNFGTKHQSLVTFTSFGQTYMSEAPSSPEPLHPIKSQDSGVRLMTKPTIALHQVRSKIVTRCSINTQRTYKAVGLPKIFLKSPLTWFCGAKYSFSKSSGDMTTLEAVRTLSIPAA